MHHPPIVIFHHCLLRLGDPPEILPRAFSILREQMMQLEMSGLINECSEMFVGLNDNEEALDYAQMFVPPKAKFIFHGLASRAENLTVVAMHDYCRKHGSEAYVLYTHSKGSSHAEGVAYGTGVSDPWRRAMMDDMVMNWHTCVDVLNGGMDIVCSRWLWNMADGSQHIPIGNFLWTRSSFVSQLPSMHLRERIKTSGIADVESRYEAEVFWGNGKRPNVHSMRPQGGGGIP
jgi:hypothetical protein